jgi:squalene-associated FAD-dependent desaturase
MENLDTRLNAGLRPHLMNANRNRRNVAVIGAGWAGCAAAVELARRGCEVHVYEAARMAGGRARRIELNGLALDNGQHILLGAYRDTLHVMHLAGLEPASLLMRLPMQMRYPEHGDGMQLVAPRLPAPLHMALGVLRAKGLAPSDKLAMARFASAARWMDWQLKVDCSVSALLERFDQTERLTRLLWRPLCIAALNTPPDRASAKIFLNVLRDSLAAKRQASDMLLPRADLSALFPDAALAYVQKHGGTVTFGAHIRQLSNDDADTNGRWRVQGDGVDGWHDDVIVATSPSNAQSLLAGLADVPDYGYEPITTCYLQYDRQLVLPHPFLALQDDPATRRWGQFVFDRGQLDASQAGLLAVVVSASETAIAEGHDTLTADVGAQLAQALQMPALAHPLWRKAVTEKRATFACVPDLPRPDNRTAQAGLWLAGDYTQGDYPATIEGAVRSGLRSASLLMAATAS